MLERLIAQSRNVTGFSAAPFAVIGNFAFQKLAMVKDLENRTAELMRSDIVAAIAGDAEARRMLSASHVDVDPKVLDFVPPANEFAVMEADSSQQCAISGIVAGQSAVVHGPPGTGKSQTITNLIATLAATGKKVLFVAEKRAALEVVMNRLASVGLDHLAIDLHGAEQTPKKVMEHVAKTLNMVRDAAVPAAEEIHSVFVDRRNRLNQHAERMHKVQSPTGLSIDQMQGLLLRLPVDISGAVRWRATELTAIWPDRAKQVRDLLGEAAGFEALFKRSDPSPWCGLELPNAQAAQSALDVAVRIALSELPSVIDALTRLTQSYGFQMPATLAAAIEFLADIGLSNEILSTYDASVFTKAENLADLLSPGLNGGLKSLAIRIFSPAYRNAYKRALSLRTAGKAAGKQVLDELHQATTVLQFWKKWSGTDAPPVPVNEVHACRQLWLKTEASLSEIEPICGLRWRDLSMSDVLARAQVLARGGVSRNLANITNTAPGPNPLAADTTLGAVPGRAASSLVIGGLTNFGGGLKSPSQYDFYWTSIQAYDDAFYTLANHTIRFGGGVERMRNNIVATSSPAGLFTFGSTADFIAGRVQNFSAQLPDSVPEKGLRQTLGAGYVLDDWKALPNLTLNMGVRYEATTVPTEVHGNLSRLVNLTDSAPKLGGTYFSNPTLKNFEPRVGLAWSPRKNQNTAVRAGFGVFDILPLPYQFELLSALAAPCLKVGGVVYSNTPVPYTTTEPGDGKFAHGSYSSIQAASTLRQSYIQPNPSRSYLMEWNLNVEQDLGHSLSMYLGFVGSKGVHQPFRTDEANTVQPIGYSNGHLTFPKPGTAPVLNPNVGQIAAIFYNNNTYYDGLEAGFTKTMSHGLQAQVSYTYSKSIDLGSAVVAGDPFGNSISGLFFFAPSTRIGVADFNVPNEFTFNYLYQTPHIKSLHGPLDLLESVQDRTYPLTRSIFIYLNHVAGKSLDPNLKEFLFFVLSRQGQEVIRKQGEYLPLPSEVVLQQRARLEQ